VAVLEAYAASPFAAQGFRPRPEAPPPKIEPSDALAALELLIGAQVLPLAFALPLGECGEWRERAVADAALPLCDDAAAAVLRHFRDRAIARAAPIVEDLHAAFVPAYAAAAGDALAGTLAALRGHLSRARALAGARTPPPAPVPPAPALEVEVEGEREGEFERDPTAKSSPPALRK
jgi:hypothetical protein